MYVYPVIRHYIISFYTIVIFFYLYEQNYFKTTFTLHGKVA